MMATLLGIAVSIADTLLLHGVVAVNTMATWFAISPEAVIVGIAGIIAGVVAVTFFREG